MNKILIGGLILILMLTALRFALQVFSDPSGFSDDTQPVSVTISSVRLNIPQNLIRFQKQRKPGSHDRLDLFFDWPSLDGYTKETRDNFENTNTTDSLIFVSLEKSPPLDAPQQRLDQIYRRFLIGKPWRGPNGLIGQSFDPQSGYGAEDVFYAHTDTVFLTRCLREKYAATNKLRPTCLYDFTLKNGVNVHVRFTRSYLKHWREINTAIKREIMRMQVQG